MKGLSKIEQPLVSVIVAAYNVEEYLCECLDSILAQDYRNFEIIAVNDASTDNTNEILDDYQKKDRRIRVISLTKNSGLSAVRNKGIEVADGEYILFVDGDDMISEKLLNETVFYAEKYKLDAVSFGYREFTYEQEWKYSEKKYIKGNMIKDTPVNGKRMLTIRRQYREAGNDTVASVSAWSMLYNRSFLSRNKLRFLEGIVHEDYLFWFLCCLRAERVMILPKEFYFYRRNTGSITTSYNKWRAKSYVAVMSVIYAEWIKGDFLQDENEAIEDFMSSLWARYLKAKFRGETGDMKVNHAIDYAYRLLQGSVRPVFGNISTEEIEGLNKVETFFIYGAGTVAAEVLEQLDDLHLKPAGVMVSYKKGNPDFFNGLPVKTLDEWGFRKNAAVVIAILGRNSAGVEEKLRHVGYEMIIRVQE